MLHRAPRRSAGGGLFVPEALHGQTTCRSVGYAIPRRPRMCQYLCAGTRRSHEVHGDGRALARRQAEKWEETTEVKKWNMVIDCARCHDCNDCFLADKDEFVGNDFPPYSVAQPWSGHRWMNIERKERGQYPIVQAGYLPMPASTAPMLPAWTARRPAPSTGARTAW